MTSEQISLGTDPAFASRRSGRRSLAAVWLAICLAGCASKAYVVEQVRQRELATIAHVTAMQNRVEESRRHLEQLETAAAAFAHAVAAAAAEVQDASARAETAIPVAGDSFTGTILLVDDSVRFPSGTAELAELAADLLDALAAQVLVRNEDVILEIQGHTDSRGSEASNRRLGLARAESVRRYLSQRHGIPPARLEVISLGSAAPIADNSSPEGRARNRRVTIVIRSR
jgi:outer membrane protein OmpA-like peptidoglycan-associated protein